MQAAGRRRPSNPEHVLGQGGRGVVAACTARRRDRDAGRVLRRQQQPGGSSSSHSINCYHLMVSAGEILTVKVDAMSRRAAGWRGGSTRVVFVPTRPGDRLEVEVFETKSNARPHQAGPLGPRPRRPAVRHAAPSGARRGGCDWQHLAYRRSSSTSRDCVSASGSRTPKLVGAVRARPPWGYRNKVRFPSATASRPRHGTSFPPGPGPSWICASARSAGCPCASRTAEGGARGWTFTT